MTIERAKKFIEELDKRRIPIIGPEILGHVDEIAKDKEKAVRFLQKGGFLDSKGELAAKYRSDETHSPRKPVRKRK